MNWMKGEKQSGWTQRSVRDLQAKPRNPTNRRRIGRKEERRGGKEVQAQIHKAMRDYLRKDDTCILTFRIPNSDWTELLL